ncbi:MAG: DNA repair protein RadA [Thermodesulfobacteriota bacterium]
MAKKKSVFVCQSCAYRSPKWMGRCPDCGQWNSLVEEVPRSDSPVRRGWFDSGSPPSPVPLSSIPSEKTERLSTGWPEVDRVLGGGLVSGSVILVGGDPGIGKSTLLLQLGCGLAAQGARSVYLSGEESPHQIKIRAERLGLSHDHLWVMAEPNLERSLEACLPLDPELLIVDSIQTLYTDSHPSLPGSVGQLRETTAILTSLAKGRGMIVILVGHVTKEGVLAGPKILEHMVDTVLYLEGDRGHPFRIMRAVKNRFGSTDEICILEMREGGLEEVLNPSERFLKERPSGVSGSVVLASIEGNRPLLVELQALVARSSFGMPRRATMGVDGQRAALLIAVLEKRVGMHLAEQDIYLNVIGGLRVEEPGVDLGIVSAIASSHMNRPLDPDLVLFGEIGLTGEVRGIQRVSPRLREAHRMGFQRCLLPKGNLEQFREETPLELIGVESVGKMMEVLF